MIQCSISVKNGIRECCNVTAKFFEESDDMEWYCMSCEQQNRVAQNGLQTRLIMRVTLNVPALHIKDIDEDFHTAKALSL